MSLRQLTSWPLDGFERYAMEYESYFQEIHSTFSSQLKLKKNYHHIKCKTERFEVVSSRFYLLAKSSGRMGGEVCGHAVDGMSHRWRGGRAPKRKKRREKGGKEKREPVLLFLLKIAGLRVVDAEAMWRCRSPCQDHVGGGEDAPLTPVKWNPQESQTQNDNSFKKETKQKKRNRKVTENKERKAEKKKKRRLLRCWLH